MIQLIKSLVKFDVKILFLLISLAGIAEARLKPDPIDILENKHFYVGVGTGYSFYTMSADFLHRIETERNGRVSKRSADVFTPFLGIRFRQKYSISLEVGYIFHQPLGIHPHNTNEGKLVFRNHYVDFAIHFPLSLTSRGIRFDIPVGLGIGHFSVKEKDSVGLMGSLDSYTKYGARAKIGVEYNFDDHLAIRVLAKYQRVGHRSGLYAVRSFKSAGADIVWAI